jgi:hypothetical protein
LIHYLIVPPSKDKALQFAKLTEISAPVRIYSNGFRFEGGIGASALLYLKDRFVKTLRCHLGTDKEHTVYKADGMASTC